MDLTEVLARFWGIILIGSLAAIFVNKNFLPQILRMKDKDEYLFLTGFLSLLLGAIHVAVYSYWEMNVRGLITLFGWIALIKGLIRFMVPEFSKNSIDKVVKNKTLYYGLLSVFALIGVYLLYIGFVA